MNKLLLVPVFAVNFLLSTVAVYGVRTLPRASLDAVVRGSLDISMKNKSPGSLFVDLSVRGHDDALYIIAHEQVPGGGAHTFEVVAALKRASISMDMVKDVVISYVAESRASSVAVPVSLLLTVAASGYSYVNISVGDSKADIIKENTQPALQEGA